MIDPNLITTARVGELPEAVVSLTDNIPHEVGSELKRATIQQLADVIGVYLNTVGGVGFRAVTITDGQTLPATTANEFILVGIGTFQNVGGGDPITTTEELNALVSNGVFWSIGVEIPINVEFAGITQQIREGFLDTVPSEDKLFKALALKANTSDIAGGLELIDYPQLIQATSSFAIPAGKTAKQVFVNKTQWFKLTGNNAYQVDTWTQTGATITLKKPASINNYITIFYQ